MNILLKSKPTKEEINCVRSLMKQYIYLRDVVENFEERESALVEQLKKGIVLDEAEFDEIKKGQIRVYQQSFQFVDLLDRAQTMIPDRDAQHMLEIRYIKGYSGVKTLLYFSGKYSEATVMRRMNKGLEVMTQYLKESAFFEVYKDLLKKDEGV